MSWPKDVYTFVGLVSKKWWGLVGAMTVATTLLWLLQPNFPFSVLPGFFWLVSCLLLVVATFGVWRREHQRVLGLEAQDADLRFDPVRGDALVEPRVSLWTIGPRLIAPKIGLVVWFTLVNRGKKAGTLDDLGAQLPESQGESRIVFRSLGMHQYPGQGGPNILRAGDSFQPDEPLRVACHLEAAVKETIPKEFAEQIGRLEDFDLVLAWSFHGVGESRKGDVVAPVKMKLLKQIVYSQWELENRRDLVRIAEEAGFQVEQQRESRLDKPPEMA